MWRVLPNTPPWHHRHRLSPECREPPCFGCWLPEGDFSRCAFEQEDTDMAGPCPPFLNHRQRYWISCFGVCLCRCITFWIANNVKLCNTQLSRRDRKRLLLMWNTVNKFRKNKQLHTRLWYQLVVLYPYSSTSLDVSLLKRFLFNVDS